MRGWTLAGLLVLTALAGCSGPEDADTDPDPDGDDPAVAVPAPVWQVGDWWTYRFDGGGSVTWVVTEDGGDDWILDVDDPELAFHHAALEEVSTIGRIGKDTLAGSQGEDRILFFDFPLHDGKAWQMTWDGERFDAVAHELEDGRWHVTYAQDDTVLRDAVYDEQAGWFRSIGAVDGNGTRVWEATLQRSGSSYSDAYVRWDVHTDVRVQVGVGGFSESTFTVPEEATDIWYAVRLFCSPEGLEGDQGPYGYQVRPSDELQGEFGEIAMCPNDLDEQGALAALPGSWTVQAFSAGATIDLRVIVRTMHELRL